MAAWRAEAARSALPHKFQYSEIALCFRRILRACVDSVGTFCFPPLSAYLFQFTVFVSKKFFRRKFITQALCPCRKCADCIVSVICSELYPSDTCYYVWDIF